MELNVTEVSRNFSDLIGLLESGQEDFITIARDGRPVAKIMLIDESSVSNRIGVARGEFDIYGDFDSDNEEIAGMFLGGTL